MEYTEQYFVVRRRPLPTVNGVERFALDQTTVESWREPMEKTSYGCASSRAESRRPGITPITKPSKTTVRRYAQKFTEAQALEQPTRGLLKLDRVLPAKDKATGGSNGLAVHAICSGTRCGGKARVIVPLPQWMGTTGARGCKRCRHHATRGIHAAAVAPTPRDDRPFVPEERRR